MGNFVLRAIWQLEVPKGAFCMSRIPIAHEFFAWKLFGRLVYNARQFSPSH
ncbi:hypothetical protein CJA_2704 [Cellvibrio japonicus Ueda107]|uniref:Uncharacterized protein n=1 Tax=Cellvibrio japonicus (strain Ueda107) TaxID=498211 RepID=B3PBD7_CELJU|nr:hypothetical protein CJA_2704 [Cellvibrio japonicus Ueda107]